LENAEIIALNAQSKLVKKYQETLDRESAYEILNQKITAAVEAAPAPEPETSSGPTLGETLGKSVTKVVTSPSFIRGVFGVLMKLFK